MYLKRGQFTAAIVINLLNPHCEAWSVQCSGVYSATRPFFFLRPALDWSHPYKDILEKKFCRHHHSFPRLSEEASLLLKKTGEGTTAGSDTDERQQQQKPCV